MDVYTTHGAFSWSELMTSDPAAAAEFYGTLFGWKVEPMAMPEGSYSVLKVGDTAVGGIMSMPPNAGTMPPCWGCYVTVKDVDATARRCSELGGQIAVAPKDIPGVGRFAVILDRQGAALNIISYATQQA
jgi:predicted enzyme related to lactoylglutathione lyase